MSDTRSTNALRRLYDHVTGEVMQVVNRLLPDRRGSQSSGADGVFGCLQSCVGTLIVAITLGIALLLAVTVLGRAAWDRVTSDDDAASVAAPRVETPQDESPAAPQVEATDLAVVEGPWRIRNEELSMGGLTAPYVVVERGTFTEDGDGRLVGTSDGGDFAFGFDLVSSSANERVYTATFMGAQYTLTFDEPGHFVGEVVLDGVLERRIEGWSELDENGTPRRDLPEVGEYESTADPATGSPGGGSAVSLGIAAACGVDWLPADLALPFTTFEPSVDDNGDPLCVGTYVDDGFGSARSVLVVQSGMLGLDYYEESESLVFLGCTGDVGPIRFDLTMVGTSTDVVVSIDRRGCDAIFG